MKVNLISRKETVERIELANRKMKVVRVDSLELI